MRVFVFMPFDEGFESVYEDLILEPLEELGCTVARADTTLDQRSVMQDIIDGLANAELVIADLTGRNPNVMYELGVAHALNKPTVMLAQSIDDVPFDLRAYRVQTYSENYREATKFRSRLQEIVNEHRKKTVSFGNPVTDYLLVHGRHESPSALTISESEGNPPAVDEAGIIDLMVELEDLSGEINDVAAVLTEKGEEFQERSERVIAESQDRLRSGTAGQRRAVLSRMAVVLDTFASDMEEPVQKLHELISRMYENNERLLPSVPVESPEQRKKARDIRNEMKQLESQLEDPISQLTDMTTQTSEMMGKSRDLNRAVRKVETTMGDLVEGFRLAQAYASRMAELIDARLQDSNESADDA